MTKSQLRKTYKAMRLAMGQAEKNKLEDLILIQFQHLALTIPDSVMTYASMEQFNEFDTHLIEAYYLFQNPGIHFSYPVTDKANTMLHAVPVNDSTAFIQNPFGTDEPDSQLRLDPAELDMVIVPLLAFDKQGYRVGYGKGYYDRFLKNCRQDCIKIGFCFFEAVPLIEDIHEADIPLDYCITPDMAYSFND